MNIVVCVKRVPDTNEADIAITWDGKTIESGDLVFDINEWDKYAMEEAVLLKEKYGGLVTAVTLGPEESEDVLRRCIATGADDAIRLTDKAFEGSDAGVIANVIYQTVKDMKFDLILTGVQASDDGYSQTGQMLAALLEIPHASLVTGIEVTNGKARVQRELEGGLSELVELSMPAVLTIQTGINEPRYVSIMGIRKAAGREIKTPGLAELGLDENDVGYSGSKMRIDKLSLPPVTREAEILKGNPDEITTTLAQLLKDKGS